VILLAFVLVVNGAVPGLLVPTLGQVVWLGGFAASFAEGGLFTIYAQHFGLPSPAPVLFGLSLAYPTSLFLRTGMGLVDAYASAYALYLFLAFGGARVLAGRLGASPNLASIAATTWLTLPLVWIHAGYSALALGFALLPTYLLTVFWLFWARERRRRHFLALPVMTILSIFMDGYTFMMFAAGAGIVILVGIWPYPLKAWPRVTYAAVSFGLAYLLYKVYTVGAEMPRSPIDFFRGWGVDVLYLLVPTEGISFLADWLNLSVVRPSSEHFGDSSVWRTSWILPLLVGLVLLATRLGGKREWICGVAIFLVGFYLALGPTLKVDAERPEGASQNMPPEFGIVPTGTEILYANVPGLTQMRATYRWIGLAELGLWMLIVNGLSDPRVRKPLAISALCLITTFNIPNLRRQWNFHSAHRSQWQQMVQDFNTVRRRMRGDDVYVVLPYNNGMMNNYMAPYISSYTYNIGGDKNLYMSSKEWPASFQGLFTTVDTVESKMGHRLQQSIKESLERGYAEVVLVPFIDTLLAPHSWKTMSPFADEYRSFVERFEEDNIFSVETGDLFGYVRLSSDISRRLADARNDGLTENCIYTRCIARLGFSTVYDSQVGKFEDGALSTTGHEGYLLFGPYEPLKAGTYELNILGIAPQAEETFVDIASGRGKVLHAKHDIASGSGPVLLQETVEIDEDVTDVEVRLYVTADTEMAIEAYELRRVGD
jgi:hypothetical protein